MKTIKSLKKLIFTKIFYSLIDLTKFD